MIRPEGFSDALDMRIVSLGTGPESRTGTQPGIPERQVHVWSGTYAGFGQHPQEFPELLSSAETARFRGFRKPADARKYLIRHALVRVILGSYLRKSPGEIRLAYGENGRPELEPGPEPCAIRFSLTTADEVFSLAVSRELPVGLDIVDTLTRHSFAAIGGYCFTDAELEWIRRETPSRRTRRFFRIWALKEALLKASGGTAGMMWDEDVSGIVRDSLLGGWYPLVLAGRKRQAFIQESACGNRHHQAVVCLAP